MAAEVTTTDTAPAGTTPTAVGKNDSFIKRELNGASFLTLEHIGHMVLVVVVTALIAMGVLTAISMWTNSSSVTEMLVGNTVTSALQSGGALKYIEAGVAISIVAALVVLVPMFVLLDRRTRAEWSKRPGFAGRVAYKAPVYTALGVLVAAKIGLVIQMLAIVLTSIALLGTDNAPIGDIYVREFLPLLVTTIIFGVSGLYVFKLAKGKDAGQMFSMMMALVGFVLAIALFITAFTTFHTKPDAAETPSYPPANSKMDGSNYPSSNSQKNLEDLFKD